VEERKKIYMMRHCTGNTVKTQELQTKN